MKLVMIIILSFTCLAAQAAQGIFYPAITINKESDNMVRFYECRGEDNCRIIGDVEGYYVEDFDFMPGMRKLRAVGTGVGITAAVAAMTLTGGGLGIIFSGGLTSGSIAGTIAGLVVGAGIGGTGAKIATTKIRAVNPVYQWKLSDIQKQLEINIFNDENFTQYVIEFDNNKSMNEYKDKYLSPILNRLD